MNSSIPITGGAIIPVSTADVSAITNIALSIPDFEGSATLRIFSNATQTEIGCFQAVMRNGASFSHPAAVSSVLGIFTIIALLASFATASYGVSVPQIRTHYAHSLSVLVIFEAFQTIFFSGTLSLNWPSVLPAWWSNFAWSAGQIYTKQIIKSVNGFAGVSGNSSQVGGAGSTPINSNGGLQQQIYGRSLETLPDYSMAELFRRGEEVASQIYKRAVNETADPRMYSWAGLPVSPGNPVPGNWTGFAGELADISIPVADAFIVGFLWFLILVSILIGATIIFKYSLELFSRMKWMKHDRLALFRRHWLGFLGLILLRSMLIGFFMMMTLTLFQFSYGGKGGVTAIAVIVFLIFFAGAFGAAFYACFYRARFGKYASSADRIHFRSKKIMKFIPWYSTVLESSIEESDNAKSSGSVSIFKLNFISDDAEHQSVHDDTAYTKRFGWLSARYRRTRWWFFAFWVVYQFVRAAFIGGARASPSAQVFGLFVWEILAFICIAIINPFEGARNTTLAVYMLGLTKVATAGLSIGFLRQFNLPRIPVTVIGVVIIVIQGFLVIGLLILIALGALSSYMSLTRNREDFKPHGLEKIRMKYFGNLEKKAADLPPPPPVVPEGPVEPYFTVGSVRRAPKIEDEDVDFVPDMQHPVAQATFSQQNRVSRANSTQSHHSSYGSVPYGARVHRASWSSRDFQNLREEDEATGESSFQRSPSGHDQHNSLSTIRPLVRSQASHSSLRSPTPTREQTRRYSSQRMGLAE
jgi:hypothetical protein